MSEQVIELRAEVGKRRTTDDNKWSGKTGEKKKK
jgi:hypothetical protein